MTITFEREEGHTVPFLRVFDGTSGDHSNGPADAVAIVPFELDKIRAQRRADYFWSGRGHAMRKSARIAA